MKTKLLLSGLFISLIIPQLGLAQSPPPPTLLDSTNQVIYRKTWFEDPAGVIYWRCDSLHVGELSLLILITLV